MAQLIKVEPFLGPMAADPSLRGLMGALSTALQGVNSGQTSLENILGPIRRLAEALESLRSDDKRAYFSWRNLISGSAPDEQELRHLILVDPHLEFSQLQPGEVPIAAIRTAARALRLDAAHGVSVRLTGPVPLQDEEFSTLGERALLIAALALAAIIVMLWMAVRSIRLIAAILAHHAAGLIRRSGGSGRIPSLQCDLGGRYSFVRRPRYRLRHSIQCPLSGREEPRTEVRAALVATAGRPWVARCAWRRSLSPRDSSPSRRPITMECPNSEWSPGLACSLRLTLNLTLLPALIQLSRPPGAGPARIPAAGADRCVRARAPAAGGRHRLRRGAGFAAGSAAAALRLQPDAPAQFQGRIRRHLC